MRSRLRRTALLIGGLCLFLPAAAAAQKLDGDDKRFLKEVRPIILPEEKAVFEKLDDKADRLVFQEIFWARRDPNLATPENEFRQQYVKDRKTADRRYSVPSRVLVEGVFRPTREVTGSATDCGRLFILFGEPDETAPAPTRVPAWGMQGSLQPSWKDGGPANEPFETVRGSQVWVYKDRSDRRLATSQVEIAFDHECRGGSSLPAQLDRMAAMKVVHPNIDYRVGDDGHLVKPADQI